MKINFNKMVLMSELSSTQFHLKRTKRGSFTDLGDHRIIALQGEIKLYGSFNPEDHC